MPISKRKMNRKRWKQPEIIGKHSNDRLGLNFPLPYGKLNFASTQNVFVKPNEQCRACSDIVMARSLYQQKSNWYFSVLNLRERKVCHVDGLRYEAF